MRIIYKIDEKIWINYVINTAAKLAIKYISDSWSTLNKNLNLCKNLEHRG